MWNVCNQKSNERLNQKCYWHDWFVPKHRTDGDPKASSKSKNQHRYASYYCEDWITSFIHQSKVLVYHHYCKAKLWGEEDDEKQVDRVSVSNCFIESKNFNIWISFFELFQVNIIKFSIFSKFVLFWELNKLLNSEDWFWSSLTCSHHCEISKWILMNHFVGIKILLHSLFTIWFVWQLFLHIFIREIFMKNAIIWSSSGSSSYQNQSNAVQAKPYESHLC